MTGSEQDKEASGGKPEGEELPFSVDLWTVDSRAVERVLARAASGQLARAMFAAARAEHPERHLTLRQGTQIIESTEPRS